MTSLITALTVACLVLLWLVVPPAASWLLLNASWTGASSEACREAAGACWSVIAVKHRLIFFGVYPAPILDATAASVDNLVNNYSAALQAAQSLALIAN